MNRPNLFKYATSELSQDAFICWLLEWAQNSHIAEDASLNGVARNVLNQIFKKCDKEVPASYENIRVIRQYKNIDVLIIINKHYALIIEDKTGTEDHGTQLHRYWEEIRDVGVKIDDHELRFGETQILRIYFKTGDQSDYNRVKEYGYVPFLRSDMLSILQVGRQNGVTNAIYVDFLSYLEEIENGVMSYQSKLLKDWEWPSWIGFFKALNSHQTMCGRGTWKYVPNPSGGFLGFYWAWRVDPCNPSSEPYLQLEQDKLCFKVKVEEKADHSRLRSEWHDLIFRAGGGSLCRPKRFGKGRWMTVALYSADGKPADYRIAKGDGTIDLDATVGRLKEAEVILDRAIAARMSDKISQ